MTTIIKITENGSNTPSKTAILHLSNFPSELRSILRHAAANTDFYEINSSEYQTFHPTTGDILVPKSAISNITNL